MKYKKALVTGGAGFVGAHLCLGLKKHFPKLEVIALDNLHRKGSELNVPRLEKQGVVFIKGDVRFRKDLKIDGVDLLIECSAEPSVLAGIISSPEYLLETNLIGAINCFELARKNKADVIFLSSSRVYPIKILNALNFKESETRYLLDDSQWISGTSKEGISENFPLEGVRTLYGSTKLSAELLLGEYIENYEVKGVINRCGLITGTWQMGKADQGVIAFWMAHHIYNRPLSYIGFGGSGKQVRDMIDIDDLFDLLILQIRDIEKYNGKTYNVGGGLMNSISLLELTRYCQEISGNTIEVNRIKEGREGDIKVYISDCKKISAESGWLPRKRVTQTLEEIYKWIMGNKKELENIL